MRESIALQSSNIPSSSAIQPSKTITDSSQVVVSTQSRKDLGVNQDRLLYIFNDIRLPTSTTTLLSLSDLQFGESDIAVLPLSNLSYLSNLS
jgi:hypothetical protein